MTTMIRCLHCLTDVALDSDAVALREHAMTCEKSPVVQELQRLRDYIDKLERQLELQR